MNGLLFFIEMKQKEIFFLKKKIKMTDSKKPEILMHFWYKKVFSESLTTIWVEPYSCPSHQLFYKAKQGPIPEILAKKY